MWFTVTACHLLIMTSLLSNTIAPHPLLRNWHYFRTVFQVNSSTLLIQTYSLLFLYSPVAWIFHKVKPDSSSKEPRHVSWGYLRSIWAFNVAQNTGNCSPHTITHKRSVGRDWFDLTYPGSLGQGTWKLRVSFFRCFGIMELRINSLVNVFWGKRM